MDRRYNSRPRAYPQTRAVGECSQMNRLGAFMYVTCSIQERLVVGVHPPLGVSSKATQSTAAHTALTTFVDLLKNGGGTPEQVHNIDAARWKKIIWYETRLRRRFALVALTLSITGMQDFQRLPLWATPHYRIFATNRLGLTQCQSCVALWKRYVTAM